MAGQRVVEMTAPPPRSNVPKLSVVVASLNGRRGLQDCLDSILADKTVDAEIIVTSRNSDEPSSELSDRYRDVAFIQFPSHTQLPVLLDAASARSKGEVIAVTVSSCVVTYGWASSIL